MDSENANHSGRDWVVVVAIARNGVIGNKGTLPWRLSSDLKRFKQMTMGHCLLMGRKTFDSIGRALPGRQTIVLSKAGVQATPDVAYARSPQDVPALVEPNRRVMVVGGAQIYEAVLPHCNEIWLTRVLADVEGDVCFPDIDWTQWKLVSTESIPSSEKDQYATEFQVWKRVA